MGMVSYRGTGDGANKPASILGRLGLSLFFLFFFAMGSLFEVFILHEAGRAMDQRSWKKTLCTIVTSEVQSTYSAAQDVMRKYPAGQTTICYVNPANADEAVLKRDSILFGLVALVVYQFLALFNPVPTLDLSSPTIPLGGSAELRWSFAGRASRIRELAVTLRGVERATYRKGTRDVGVLHTHRIDSPGALGSDKFGFTLPPGPYSFSGKLISLIWALELTCTPGSETVRREIVVSPTGREILLTSVAGQGRGQDNQPGPFLKRILGVPHAGA